MLAGAALALGAPGTAAAGHEQLLRAVRAFLPAAERADAAGAWGPSGAAAQYEAGRALGDALPRAGYVGPGCLPLWRAVRAYADWLVREAEAYDRRRQDLAAAAAVRAARARARVVRLRRGCATRDPRRAPVPDVVLEPRSGSAFFGRVVDEAVCAREAELLVDGRPAGRAASRAPSHVFSFALRAPPGVHRLEVRQRRGGRTCWRATARDVVLLPPGSRRARAPRGTDAPLAGRLARAGGGFRGWAGLWAHDLVGGRTAGWNADALFPAASTVKLGVLVAALGDARFHPYRGDAPAHDLEAMVRWSSNLATNRLLRLLGAGSEVAGARRARAALVRMGATRSTFPQGYQVGTWARAGGRRQPPLVSARVTTARELGRVLWYVHAAAAGNRHAQRRTRLSTATARYALGLLLRWEPGGDNTGLVAPSLAHGTLVAQKNGWLDDARHTAAVVYGPRGPTIVVVLAYREGLPRRDAVALGARVARAVWPPRR